MVFTAVACEDEPCSHVYGGNVVKDGKVVKVCSVCGNEIAGDEFDSQIYNQEELAKFLSEGESGSAILADDIELTAAVTSTGKKVLDLGGKEIKTTGTFTTDVIMNSKNGELTINNGTISYKGDVFADGKALVCNEASATFNASELRLEAIFPESGKGSGAIGGFFNHGKAVFNDASSIVVKNEAKEGTKPSSVMLIGIWSYDADDCFTKLENSSVEVYSSSVGSVYGFYTYLNDSKGKIKTPIKAELWNSSITVIGNEVGSVAPVFAESYDENAHSIVDIVNCTIKGESTVENNKKGEDQKIVYSIRAKGYAVINVDVATASRCTAISADKTEGSLVKIAAETKGKVNII